jgi:hypothetical protein
MRTSASLVRGAARTAITAGAVVSLAAVSACGTASTPSRTALTAAPVTPSLTSFSPVAVSFVSPLDGWVLGITLPGRSRIELVTTTDGGRGWKSVPVPPAPWAEQGSRPPVNSIAYVTFASARDGWLYGPALWATDDGGASWHQVAMHGAQVTDVQASRRYVFATLTGCHRQCRSGLYRSPVGRDEFRLVPGSAGAGQVVLSGSTGYAIGASRQKLFTGPVTGSARWHQLPLPCTGRFYAAVVAASSAGLALACNAPLGAHPTPSDVYLSASHGLSWHEVSGFATYDGAAFLSIAPDGLLVSGGIYNGLVISRDGGRTWHNVESVDTSTAVGGGGPFDAAMITDSAGFALLQPLELWLTRNGARTWERVKLPGHAGY